ncbi:MAG: hypothetical protein NTU77_04600, partial [Actinobacteria bacterium]|nr:hypothetical protein [Actinomycetota bacterium]
MTSRDSASGDEAAASSLDAVPIAIPGSASFPRRVRRPLDLARFVVAILLTASIVLVAWFATSTAAGLGTDLSTGAQLLPSLIVLALNIIGGIGTLGLPIAASIALVVRRRLRQLFDALVALLVTIVVLTIAANVISSLDSPRLLAALAGSAGPGGTATAPILGGLIAFITVARLMGRRPWNVLSILVIGSLVTIAVINSGIALAGVGVSISIGWAIGPICRYALGTPTTRPSADEIIAALSRGGFTIESLAAETTTSRGRRYHASTTAGQQLRIAVLDRDLEGAGLVSALWTAVRLRSDSGAGAFNMRRSLDHTALMYYAGQAAEAPMPRLLLASEIGPDSSLLAFEHIDGIAFSDATDLTDTDLDDAWRAVKILHDHQISHRSLSAEHLIKAETGGVQLVGYDGGSVAAGDVSMRIDLAEMLCTLALIVGVDRAVASGQRVLGEAGLLRALPTLQPVALSSSTRRAMRKNKQVMVGLRDVLIESRPGEPVEQIRRLVGPHRPRPEPHHVLRRGMVSFRLCPGAPLAPPDSARPTRRRLRHPRVAAHPGRRGHQYAVPSARGPPPGSRRGISRRLAGHGLRLPHPSALRIRHCRRHPARLHLQPAASGRHRDRSRGRRPARA